MRPVAKFLCWVRALAAQVWRAIMITMTNNAVLPDKVPQPVDTGFVTKPPCADDVTSVDTPGPVFPFPNITPKVWYDLSTTQYKDTGKTISTVPSLSGDPITLVADLSGNDRDFHQVLDTGTNLHQVDPTLNNGLPYLKAKDSPLGGSFAPIMGDAWEPSFFLFVFKVDEAYITTSAAQMTLYSEATGTTYDSFINFQIVTIDTSAGGGEAGGSGYFEMNWWKDDGAANNVSFTDAGMRLDGQFTGKPQIVAIENYEIDKFRVSVNGNKIEYTVPAWEPITGSDIVTFGGRRLNTIQNQPFDGHICEMMIGSGVPDRFEFDTIVDYYINKWRD